LEKYLYNDDQSQINMEHSGRITRILGYLDTSLKPQAMNLPGCKLNKLSSMDKDVSSVLVSANWRTKFRFDGNNAVEAGYREYH